jgi:hypothetical protein
MLHSSGVLKEIMEAVALGSERSEEASKAVLSETLIPRIAPIRQSRGSRLNPLAF